MTGPTGEEKRLFGEANESLEESLENAVKQACMDPILFGENPRTAKKVARNSMYASLYPSQNHPVMTIEPSGSHYSKHSFDDWGGGMEPAVDPETPRLYRTKPASLMVGSEPAERECEFTLLPKDGRVRGDRELPGEPAQNHECHACGSEVDMSGEPIEENGEWYCDIMCYNDEWE